ncbi:hypothetical protein FJ692_02855 [Pseudomonas fluorescens]|nr:hypothetical protein C1751_03970 [Pseudomonas fluorescens]TPV60100.1 hypothetical protein FJ692_02855 [Pseudomonas fluorescens]
MWRRCSSDKYPDLIIPTLCVGIHPVTLRVTKRTRSVQGNVPTQSVGTIGQRKTPPCHTLSHLRLCSPFVVY